MNRPYIICHMTTSIDGKVTGSFLSRPEAMAGIDEYYEINRSFRADAYACGRVTMEGSFTGGHVPDLSGFAGGSFERTDRIADPAARFFAVAFDRRGRLGWQGARIVDDDPGYGGAHIVEVLCEDTPADRLAYLHSMGCSYIFAGEHDLDLPLALTKLKEQFGIEKLLLEGGSVLNGAFHRSGVIDELSLVMLPVTAEAEDKPLFDGGGLDFYRLGSVQKLSSGAVWLRYFR